MLTVSTELCTIVHTPLLMYCVHLLEAQSTGVKKAVTYAGLIYYEEKRVEDLVTFTAAKNLEALIHVCVFIFTQ